MSKKTEFYRLKPQKLHSSNVQKKLQFMYYIFHVWTIRKLPVLVFRNINLQSYMLIMLSWKLCYCMSLDKGFISSYASISQSSCEGSHAGTWSQELKQKSWRKMPAGLLPVLCSACFLLLFNLFFYLNVFLVF